MRLKALMLASFVAIACRDSTAPPAVAGSYFLSGVNGQQLPTTIYSVPTATIIVIGARILLTPDGNAVLTETQRYTYQGVTDETPSTYHLKYRVSGANITIGTFTPCAPNANCIGAFVGKIVGSTLMLNVGMMGGTPLIYTYERGDPPVLQ